MVTVVTLASRYSMIILFALYTLDSFWAVKRNISERASNHLYIRQNLMLYGILVNGSLVHYINKDDEKYLYLMVAQMLFMFLLHFLYINALETSSKALMTNMCMLYTIGFLELERLDFNGAIKQFMIACFSVLVACVLCQILFHVHFLKKLTYGYLGLGVLLLLSVCIGGTTEYGAKLSLSLGPVSLQPSEFVKILFVLFIAALLCDTANLQNRIIASVGAAIHVLILVASRDLGGASIFLLTYLIMIYVATKKPMFLFGGALGGAVAFFAAYKMFSHVQTRVVAWLDPLAVADNQGYQVSQSLFAIGAGGWIGAGLYKGQPTKIPVVSKDFIFAAISEEFGAFFALCLIFTCISSFLLILNVSMRTRDMFYKLIALGFGTIYFAEVFLCIGGTIKFIPSTGVPLPLVSYGGSSMLATTIMFTMVQCLRNMSEKKEARFNEKEKEKEEY